MRGLLWFSKPTGFQDSEPGVGFGWFGAETWVGPCLPPSFLSSSPAKNRASEGLAVKEASAGLVRPTAQRGHGPARLDSQALRATVAEKSDQLGERRTAADGPGDALKPTPRGERPCVHQARLTGSGQSVWRAIDVVCWPIRRSLFGGLAGRQACAAGWASADPWRQAQRAAFSPNQGHSKKGGKAPSGYNSPRSANDRMALPATIR